MRAPPPRSEVQVQDLVKALCPITNEWHDATVSSIRRNGLVEVRWHNPGMTADGRAFHPFGDVWAGDLRLVYRREGGKASHAVNGGALPAAITGDSHAEADISHAGPDGLRAGDLCFARGRLLEVKWFKARLLSVRSRRPRLRVEYLATLEGESNPLALPEPRKAFVNDTDLSASMPLNVLAPQPPTAAAVPAKDEEDAAEEAPTAQTAVSSQSAVEEGDGEPIDEDLMCSVCSRPDDEGHMLVCDCKKGFHIYCLSPRLDAIPEGDWRCPDCMGK